MSKKGPGRSDREGISLLDLVEMFPDEQSAVEWFEAQLWRGVRCCGHCGSTKTNEVPNRKPMPYWCGDCRSYFSVKTGTALASSKISLRKWAFAIYLEMTSLKGVSSMKLHRDIGISQKSAWFMLHRIRQAWGGDGGPKFLGPVEVDETYMGGKRKNMPKHIRAQRLGSGSAGKEAVVGIRDRDTGQVRARHVGRATKANVHGFMAENVDPEATVYTDEAGVYRSLPYRHEAVNHSVGEYVREMASTNGAESFWAALKRAHTGTFHKMSPKHLDRYVRQFAGKHNLRDADTLAQMAAVAAGLIGRRLLYRSLVAPNGLSSGARGAE